MPQSRLLQFSIAALLLLPVEARGECITLKFSSVIKYSDLIFRGVVTSKEQLDTHTIINFRVTRVWKGKLGPSATTHNVWGIEHAGFPEELVGAEYLVLASRLTDYQRKFINAGSAELFGIPDCLPATPIAHASAQLKELGRGRAPRK